MSIWYIVVAVVAVLGLNVAFNHCSTISQWSVIKLSCSGFAVLKLFIST